MPGQAKPWYEIKAAGVKAEAGQRVAEIFIYGSIGDRWDETSVIAANFVRDLQPLAADRIVVRLNSLGGSVADGIAIYNALKRHPASVEIQVDGLAVSCASLIAMAGDSLVMADNALMMIHAPWTCSYGNSADLRADADMLDKYAAAMCTSYVAKSGRAEEDCLALLTDGKDHWYTASEAQAAGFCDQVGPAVEISASMRFEREAFSRFTPPAAAAAFISPKETAMPGTQSAAAAPTPAPVTPPAAPAAAATSAVFARTKAMNEEVIALFAPFIERDGVRALERDVLADPAITVEAATTKLLTHLGKDAEPATPKGAGVRIETQADERDKFRAAASDSLLVRASVPGSDEAAKHIRANPYRGNSLLDLARICLARAGIKTDGMSKMDVVAAAFTQSTSDFPILLESAMHKTLLASYAKAALTWRRFCAVGTVSDFRAHNRYRIGSFGNLDALTELGEFKNKSIPDGAKESITASTKGNIINLSRQAVVNDDLGAFVGLASALSWAAARTIEADVYTLLASNSGVGPTMSDGNALFHTSHGNIAATGALSLAVIESIRQKMALQTDVSGNDYLDLRPSVLVTPIASGGTARELNAQEFNSESQKEQRRPNINRGLFNDVVDTPRLSGTRVYAFADPTEAPVIEVAFLDGQQEPYLELEQGFDVDGARYKVRMDYATGAVGYQGAVTAAGA